MRQKSGFAPANVCYGPAAAVATVIAGALGGGATAYSAHEQSKSAKKAAEAQERVGMANIEASLKAPQLAADAAKAKLKAKQASQTQTILTAPGGMASTDESTNKSILGV